MCVADKGPTGGPVSVAVDAACSSDSSPIGSSELSAIPVASATRLEALLNDGVCWYSSRGGAWEDRPMDALLALVVDGVRTSCVGGMRLAEFRTENWLLKAPCRRCTIRLTSRGPGDRASCSIIAKTSLLSSAISRE